MTLQKFVWMHHHESRKIQKEQVSKTSSFQDYPLRKRPSNVELAACDSNQEAHMILCYQFHILPSTSFLLSTHLLETYQIFSGILSDPKMSTTMVSSQVS